jgi:hypothetical protein
VWHTKKYIATQHLIPVSLYPTPCEPSEIEKKTLLVKMKERKMATEVFKTSFFDDT